LSLAIVERVSAQQFSPKNQVAGYRQPSAAFAARISASHSSRSSDPSAPSSTAIATSSAAHLSW
jgi:hypothetical protein